MRKHVMVTGCLVGDFPVYSHLGLSLFEKESSHHKSFRFILSQLTSLTPVSDLNKVADFEKLSFYGELSEEQTPVSILVTCMLDLFS